ncbi:unnamed protein product [Adineta steineri]|uniref:BSD domain-containing protein n=1 Tax=Adineta steineri TaxID=433720 RepID=A0A813TUM8_9BILA|nr:unnamed protein product [Adineta steineri]CAF0819587.1 unnamed protein product [Adineta steineri]
MSNWFTSTFQIVRDKSIDALEFVRKDISEFTTTVKSDAETYLNKIKNQSVDDLGIIPRLHNDDGKHIVASTTFDRLNNEKLRIQNDESTYLTDPLPTETYKTWLETSDFNVEKCKSDISQLLIDAPHVRSFHARLVPACTTYNDFWSRYYFRLYQLDEDEKKRLNLLKRAHEICNENSGNDWDGPEDEWLHDTSIVNQQSTPIIAITSETITNEKTESDTVSGDSWEREFDETDLDTSKANSNLSNALQQISIDESSSVQNSIKTTKKPDDEFDDEWESWS